MNPAVDGKQLGVELSRRRLGLEAVADLHALVDGRRLAGEQADAHSGQQRRPETRVAPLGANDRHVEHVGENLRPQVALGPAADQADFVHRQPHLLDRAEAIAEGIGHAFENRPDEVALAVPHRRPYEAAAEVGVPVGRTLAEQVGVEKQAFRAGRRLGGHRVQQGIDARPLLGRLAALVLAEDVAEPALGRGGRVRGGDRIPKTRHHVRIGQRAGVRAGLGRHHVHVAGGGQLEDHLPRADRPGRIVFHRRIGAAGHHRRSRRQPGLGRGGGRHRADHVGRRDQRRQDAHRDAGQAAQVGRPGPPGHVIKQAPLGFDMVGLPGSRQPVADVVLGEEDVLGAAERLRLVLGEPRQLRQGPGGRGLLVADAENLRARVGLQPRRLADAPLIGPHDRRAQGAKSRVGQHRVVR